MSQRNRQSDQFGGVFVYIFIGIILFAALAFTFSKSMTGTNTSVISTGQANVMASQILEQSNAVAKATEMVLQKGCSETEVKYYLENGPEPFGDPSYHNGWATGAPTGRPECLVFYPTGGKAKPPRFNPDMFILDTPQTPPFWNVTGTNRVIGIGTDDDSSGCPGCELTIGARGLKPAICEQINKLLGLPYPVNYSGDVHLQQSWEGTFANWDTQGDIPATEVLIGKSAFCVTDWDGANVFLRVLIAR